MYSVIRSSELEKLESIKVNFEQGQRKLAALELDY